MKKNNWIHPSEITVVQPKTAAAMDELEEDIELIASLMPDYEPGFVAYGMREHPEDFTVVYHNGQPVAYIEINDNTSHGHIGRDSLEFGGAVLPEYRKSGLTMQVSPPVIRKAFIERGKAKMLAIIPDENAEAVAAIRALGFRRIGRAHNGRLLYKLDRKDALAKS